MSPACAFSTPKELTIRLCEYLIFSMHFVDTYFYIALIQTRNHFKKQNGRFHSCYILYHIYVGFYKPQESKVGSADQIRKNDSCINAGDRKTSVATRLQEIRHCF